MSTEFSIGMGDGRNSSKVLKPPGGGSSDIFGTSANNTEGESQKQELSTQDRIFGSDADSQSKFDRNKSNIFVNDDAKNEAKLNKMKFVRRNPITGEIIETDLKKNGDANNEVKNGDMKNDEKDKVKKGEESVMDEGAKQQKATSIRVRQPPGGKSSGIF